MCESSHLSPHTLPAPCTGRMLGPWGWAWERAQLEGPHLRTHSWFPRCSGGKPKVAGGHLPF